MLSIFFVASKNIEISIIKGTHITGYHQIITDETSRPHTWYTYVYMYTYV